MSVVKRILGAQTNIVGTILIAAGSSLLTAVTVGTFSTSGEVAPTASALPTMSATSVLECGQAVYSPVQRKCVSQQVFDEEMKHLFAALGIDAAIYGTDNK